MTSTHGFLSAVIQRCPIIIVRSERRRDGSIDVTGKGLTAKKAPYFRAFRTSGNQCRGDDLTAKIALSE